VKNPNPALKGQMLVLCSALGLAHLLSTTSLEAIRLRYKVDFWSLYLYITPAFCKEKENEIYQNARVGQ
jgi:hypothetical protein